MKNVTLTDAVLHARAQALRHRFAKELVELGGDEADAGAVAAVLVDAAVNGDRKGLADLGLVIPGEGPVSNAEIEAAITSKSRAKRSRKE